jgi:phage baseplate assembly protein V
MSNARLGDIERRLSNMIRPGTVLEADYEKARIKVALGKNKTGWLPWVAGRAGGDRSWHAPEVGEQVLVVAPSGELASAFIMPGGVYRKDDAEAPATSPEISRTTYKDGAVVEYDRENHAHKIEVPSGGTALVKVGGATFEVKASEIKLTVGGSSIKIAGGGITIEGPVTQTGGNLTSDGIGLKTHRHTGVTAGAGNTAGPIA